MNTVQPIRDRKKINAMKVQLAAIDPKYRMLFTVGINVGLRVSDLLRLRVGDITEADRITIKEQKTGKRRNDPISTMLKKEVRAYAKAERLDPDDYLFPSRKKSEDGEARPISRVQAYRVLKEAGDMVGITDIGTHTLRKTFGYHHYQRNHDVAMLQQIFHHSAPSITLRYIGISQDQIDDSLRDFFL